MKKTHSIFNSLIALAAASSAHAALVVQTGSNSSTQDWNTIGDWDNTPMTTDDDYQTISTGLLRGGPSASGNASTFGGGSLEVVEGSALLLKNINSTSTINGAFTLSGGHLYHGPNNPGGNSTFSITTFSVSGVSDITGNALNTLTIDKNLTGSGNLFFNTNTPGGNSTVQFAGISGFTGTMTLGDASASTFGGWEGFDFDVTLGLGTADYTFQDTVTILGSSILDVGTGQTLTFNFGDLVDANNGTVAAGTYSTGDLGANYSGLGSIVVIPEPSTTLLFGLASLGLIIRRRRI